MNKRCQNNGALNDYQIEIYKINICEISNKQSTCTINLKYDIVY